MNRYAHDPVNGRTTGCFIGLISILTAALPLTPAIADGYVYNILPLGDSITHAEINRASFRYPLWKKLVDANIKIDFVGSMNTQLDSFSKGATPQPAYKGLQFDKDHEGHFAWTVDDIVKGRNPYNKTGSGSLSEWTTKYDFDIALVHLGTNDAFYRLKHDHMAATLERVVTALRADNPNAVILLAKLIPAKRQQGDSEAVAAVNEKVIPKVVEKMNMPNSPVIAVDHFSDFDVAQDTYDGVHPNASGEEKMAQRWFKAIEEALPLVTKRKMN